MNTGTAHTTFLSDYSPPDFRITHCRLHVALGFEETVVDTHHSVERNCEGVTDLVLDCEHMEVLSVSIDGMELRDNRYRIADARLIVKEVPDRFSLSVRNRIRPCDNTALTGLYQSGDMLCTQCEAEGFRRIAPAIDRPDNLSVYEVTLSGNRSDFPVLLCNGNLVDSGRTDADTHYAVWHDPFPKPTYLFAIVAGNLECYEDTFTTCSGRRVKLRFHARGGDIGKCAHAMESLKRAMAWDEEVYGREYDLDLFNVVAVEDFNMGAMENKSLNIFNTALVLADSRMATDNDFALVENVIGHEYFHNWSGNRVTCRDWFQLSLKEGFTVYRDQEFSADTGSRGVRRIAEVSRLRSHQFREDAGALAHPVRPESYQRIDNFYTETVYQKGAEIIRMLNLILGNEDFRRGTDRYFETYDGQAVTIDDFIEAMEQASGTDLKQFKRWYSQSGTPVVTAAFDYLESENAYEVTLSQHCPPTPGQESKDPFVIPVRAALFDENGNAVTLRNGTHETLLILDCPEKTFRFEQVGSPPAPSLLRGFSAPVKLEAELNPQTLTLLMHHDDDPYCRWEAGQQLLSGQLLQDIQALKQGLQEPGHAQTCELFRKLVEDRETDPAFLSTLITLPDFNYLSAMTTPIDPAINHQALQTMKRDLATHAKDALLARYHECSRVNRGRPISGEMAARRLRDTCLGYLSELDGETARNLILKQLEESRCMTDTTSALTCLAHSDFPDRSAILEQFYRDWQHEALVVDKWFRAQATVPGATTIDTVIALTEHPGFESTNPNKVRALIGAFTHGNPVGFHAPDGSGYAFARDWIQKLDAANPQVSARIASAFNNWRQYTWDLGHQMQGILETLDRITGLSPDVREIVCKNLAEE